MKTSSRTLHLKKKNESAFRILGRSLENDVKKNTVRLYNFTVQIYNN